MAMTTEDLPATEPSMTRLVTGIMQDVQDLLQQQLVLFKVEIRSDFDKALKASTILLAGGVVCVLGGMLLCLMLVHLAYWAWGPALPLWACYAAVGGLVAAVGAGLVWAGLKWFASFNPLPEQSLAEMKENVQCLTKQQ